MPFPTRMTVIRLANGNLFLHSPIRHSQWLERDLLGLGPIRHLVAPNWIHYAGLPGWQAAAPDAITWAAPGVRARAVARGVMVRWDRDLADAAPADWAGQIDQMIVHGSPVHQEAVFFHRSSRTLILTDLIENFEAARLPGWFRGLARLAGVVDPDGKAPIDMRMSFRRGKPQLRAAVEQMIDWAPERVILSHGRWYDRDGVAELRRAFRWALR
ncbi:MAG: DUF4336 domain-containing protein [Rhodobacteraceae bacterium]|nr:DUF4336 domain-containing protein [Paracoccaceae bacterium]